MLTEIEKINVRENGFTRDDVMNGITLYHRPKDATVFVGGKPMSVIDSLFKYGFSREFTGSNGGNMYGPGVYTVYTLDSSNEMATGYGNSIMKLKLLGGYNDFLIFSKQIAQRTYGEDWRIEDQVYKIFDKGSAKRILDEIYLIMHDDTCSFRNMAHSSDSAYKIVSRLGEAGMNKSKCRGLIYNGGHDGACCFIRDFSSVIPVAVSNDNGKTWKYRLSDELINRLNNEVDTHFQLGGNNQFAKISEKSVNGYVMVWNHEGKVNYVSAKSNEPISNVWFDDGEIWKILDDGTPYTNVLYNGTYYIIAFENGDYNVYGEDWEPLDMTLNDLNPVQKSAFNFSEAINNAVKKVLNESILNEHIDEVYQLDTAIGIIDKQWQSPDDFWYVYISQRKKDNLGTFVKNHNGDGSTKFSVNFIAYGIVSGNTKQEAIESLRNIKMMINPCFQNQISTKGNKVTSINSQRDISAIMLLCHKFNARCYMTINKRSMIQTNNYADTLKRRGMERGREFQFAAGRQMSDDDANVKWSVVRPWGLIDCDIDNKTAQKELEAYLAKNGITPEFKYESHDGMHYLFSTRDANKLKFDYFDRKYRPANAPRRHNDPMVLFKGDACMLLYSACGY